MNTIQSNIARIKERTAAACERCGREASEVSLLLATKTQPANRIIEALALGETLIGENRVQELVEKSDALKGWPVEKHMIGHLQSNKAAKCLDHVTCVQSVDRVSIAEKLNRLCDKRGQTLDVFLQFNTSNEVSKFGMHPDDAVPFARSVAKFTNLRIRGLMTVGLLAPHPVISRPSLAMLRTIRDRLLDEAIDGVELRELSMGMSSDLEIAIEEGATMLRIGTDIFGRREPPPGTYWPEKEWDHLSRYHSD